MALWVHTQALIFSPSPLSEHRHGALTAYYTWRIQYAKDFFFVLKELATSHGAGGRVVHGQIPTLEG